MDSLRISGAGKPNKTQSKQSIYLHEHLTRALTWNPGVVAFCRERIASFDIVHIYGFYDLLGPAAARVCRQFGVPYLVEPMGMYPPNIRNIPLKWEYRHVLADAMDRGARRVVATSAQEQKRNWRKRVSPADQVVIRRNGIEMPMHLPAPGTFRQQWRIPQG